MLFCKSFVCGRACGSFLAIDNGQTLDLQLDNSYQYRIEMGARGCPVSLGHVTALTDSFL